MGNTGFLMVLVSKVKVFSTNGATFVPPQYQELQASAQFHGDSMKETKVQISQLQQVIQRLQSQTENLKKQVRIPELFKPCLLLPVSPLGSCETLITGWSSG